MAPTATNCLALLVLVTVGSLAFADELTTVQTTVDNGGQGGITVRASTRFESREEVIGVGGRTGSGSVVYRPYTYRDQRVYYQYPYQQPT